MPSDKRVLVLDDDPVTRRIISRTLEKEGYNVREMESAEGVESALADFHPDLVLSDVMMPGRDGLAVCRMLQSHSETRSIPIVLVSAKDFEGDKRAALAAGAAGYLVKPVNPADVIRTVTEVLATSVTVTIRGCRGSIATPEHASGQYGANTACVDIALPGGRRIILDAGTGIRSLGNEIVSHSPLQVAILVTHFHWDHIQGLPFFKPLYVPGNQVSIYGPSDNEPLKDAIHGQMGGAFFPVYTEAFRASVRFIDVKEQSFPLFDAQIAALHLFHPGTTLGYRLDFGDRSLVYAPDNEILPESITGELSGEAQRLAKFASGADLLIHDCTYSDEEYVSRRGWGHSCPRTLAAVAAEANVGKVMLFHHDPDASEDAIAAIHSAFGLAIESLNSCVQSEPAREGASLVL